MAKHWIVVGTPTDEQMRAYLDGEHGPASPEVLQIIQDELEHDLRMPPGSTDGGA